MKQKHNSAVLNGNNRHIVLFGKTGSGKSSIFEQLVEGETVRVSSSGFNPVVGVCKLGREGTATLVDTAELNGTSELAGDVIRRTFDLLRRADIAIYVVDMQEFDREAYIHDHDWLVEKKIPYLLVFNHCDESYVGDIARLKTEFPHAVFISTQIPGSISLLRARLSQMLRTIAMQETPLVPKGVVKHGDYVLMLVSQTGDSPIRDEHAMMNELIAAGAYCVLVEENDLQKVLDELPHVDLVIVSARMFEKVRDVIPKDIPLTSYSLLYGHRVDALNHFADGARVIEKLNNDSHVLIAEGCLNSGAHRDIGRVKIPRALRKIAGEGLSIDYSFGLGLPEDISKYDLVIHCSGCSMTQNAVKARVNICREAGVPIANYGTVLAELSGVLERCEDVLK